MFQNAFCCASGSGDLKTKLEWQNENCFGAAIYFFVGHETASGNECIGHVLGGGDLALVPKLVCCDVN